MLYIKDKLCIVDRMDKRILCEYMHVDRWHFNMMEQRWLRKIGWRHFQLVITSSCLLNMHKKIAIGWDQSMVGDLERALKLHVIPSTCTMYQNWRGSLLTLLLTQYDLRFFEEPCYYQFSAEKYNIDQFDKCMKVFSKSWKLQRPLFEHMQIQLLKILLDVELHMLHQIVTRGCALRHHCEGSKLVECGENLGHLNKLCRLWQMNI